MEHELRIERSFDAPPKLVFDTFFDPDAQRALYADGPDWIVESELDMSVGGTWTVTFGPSRGELYREVSVFSQIDRPHRVAYSTTATFADGRTFDTRSEVVFRGVEGRTHLALLQTGFPTAEMRDDFTGGWSDILDALDGVVVARTSGAQ
jgi:uncharacterized protein YndB with AHSA1/START domain